MSYDYDFEVDHVEDDVFIITAASKNRRIHIQGDDIYIL